MKKLTLIVVALLVMGAVLPVAAQDDAHALAQYFPVASPFYIEVRTDDDFLQTIDALISRISALMPNARASESFLEMIDEGIRDEIDPNGSFATTIRPWLGDQAALGFLSFDEGSFYRNEPPMLLAVAITDANAAAAFFAQSDDFADDYTSEARDGFTLYSPEDDDDGDEPFVVIRSDVLIVTTDATTAQAGGIVALPLSADPLFVSALNALPLESYDASAYIDTPTFFEAVARDRGNADDWEVVEPFLSAVQPQAFGFVVQNERALVFDVASPIDPNADLPFAMPVTEPVNPEFVWHIPANTALVVQGTNLYQSYETSIENLRQLAQTMSEYDDDFDQRDLNTALFGINFAVRGVTGMSVDDAFGWMTGNYALALGLSPSFADASSINSAVSALPIDFAVILEATDDTAVQNLFDGLTESISGFEADNVTIEAATDSIHITITPNNAPFPIELVIAKNDDVFVVGTQRMVRAALDPQEGLALDASFVEASDYFLDGTNALFYLGSDALSPLTRVMLASDNPSSVQRNGQEIKALLGMFDSVSITSAALPDNAGSVARFVWLLP